MVYFSKFHHCDYFVYILHTYKYIQSIAYNCLQIQCIQMICIVRSVDMMMLRLEFLELG